MHHLKPLLLVSLSLLASACALEDDNLDPDADLDEPELGVAATCVSAAPPWEVTKTVTSAPGVSALAPSTAYWTSGDGAFTMHVNGLGSFSNDSIYGRATLQTSVPTSKDACERTHVTAAIWGRNKDTGCWSLFGGTSHAGVWTQDVTPPFNNSFCRVVTDTPQIDGWRYTQARVATSAYRHDTFPIAITIPLRVTAVLVVDDN